MSHRAPGRHRAPRPSVFETVLFTVPDVLRRPTIGEPCDWGRPRLPAGPLRTSAAVVLTGGLVTVIAAPADAGLARARSSAQPVGSSAQRGPVESMEEPVRRSEMPAEQAGDAVEMPWSQRTDDEEASQLEGPAQPPDQPEDTDLDSDPDSQREAEEPAGRRGASPASPKSASPKSASSKPAQRTSSAKATTVPKKQPNRAQPRQARAGGAAAVPRRTPPKSATNRAVSVQTGMRAVSLARSLGGIRYVWGGTTTSGFDCSGFTRYVYRKAGVNLPRTAAAQQRAVRRVSNPRPGDLVFFGNPAHHVGIYAGNGTMYDAPRKGRTTGLHRIWSAKATYGRVPGARLPAG